MFGTSIAVLLALVAGGVTGWIAAARLHLDSDVTGEVVLGTIGAAMASSVLYALGVGFAGVLAYVVAGAAGASLLIAAIRVLRRH